MSPNPLSIKAKQSFVHLSNAGLIPDDTEKIFNIGFTEGVLYTNSIFEKQIKELKKLAGIEDKEPT